MPFTDETPVTVTFTTDKGALAALLDNPLQLHGDIEGSYFANAVRRGVRHLRAGGVVEEEGMGAAPEYPPLPLPPWAVRLIWAFAGLSGGFVLGAVLT